MWRTEIGKIVKDDLGKDYLSILERTREVYAQDGNLEKSTMFIADAVSTAWESGHRSENLQKLVESVLSFAHDPWPAVIK